MTRVTGVVKLALIIGVALHVLGLVLLAEDLESSVLYLPS